MSPVGPLCQLRAAVRLGLWLGLPRAAAWGAGRRALGTRGAQAGAHERPGSRGCAVRLGCASAFWGDTAAAVPQLLYEEKLDYLVFDYLSEITMCLLTAAKIKSPDLGYVPDFVQMAMAPYIKDIHKKGVRVVSNAGGTNPLMCAAALDKVARKAGVDLKIAVVTGDDILGEKEALQGSAITDMESGKKFPDTIESMNVYLGARPISRALDLGADVVLTGRCVDSALVLGPLVHAFGWKSSDFDLLAAGSLAGHLIECGAQSTGGIFTDWHLVPDWHNIGFPVLECFPDGQFTLSKPPGTGGMVSFGTVAEQLVYEIGDPQRFLLPDVTCDFSQVSITEIPGVEGGAVRVQGAKGSLPSSFYKVSASYHDGFRATAVCPIGGPKAIKKGRRTAESILKRTRLMFEKAGLEDYSEVHVQILGSEETYGAQAKANLNGGPREVVLWLSVHHKEKKALEIFSREIAPAGTGMAPGLMGVVGGRPKVSPVLKPFFFLYPKKKVKIDIHLINGEHIETFHEDLTFTQDTLASPNLPNIADDLKDLPSGSRTYRLEDLAYARSGDKGNSANIGIIARHPLYYPYLKKFLTAQAIEDYFQHILHKEELGENSVIRYDLPGIYALNFVLKNSLGGGGTASLRSDPQGKALGQMVLDIQIKNVPDLKSLVGG
ncbi:uncharacterized protein LOC118711147 isoform X2 [Pipistrellus kuhlii]|uniref:Uncharacterized protein n=1 Tax=Pipistrellus kuhlii TaxID=59472 RepID=A0A7J7XBZ4_PIPKU|nr:uncharacterized protein LOC118711147 isoform X2 [Pipistrellus kuhlii]KAF6346916.1 hypothetical protein mPipKuh1_010650 [Pipistrellus kuhlii]